MRMVLCNVVMPKNRSQTRAIRVTASIPVEQSPSHKPYSPQNQGRTILTRKQRDKKTGIFGGRRVSRPGVLLMFFLVVGFCQKTVGLGTSKNMESYKTTIEVGPGVHACLQPKGF